MEYPKAGRKVQLLCKGGNIFLARYDKEKKAFCRMDGRVIEQKPKSWRYVEQ